MTLMASLVAHYAEIGTKGANRSRFESRLESNIRSRLRDVADASVTLRDQRFLVRVPDSAKDSALGTLRQVFGVAWAAETAECSLDYGAAKQACIEVLAKREGDRTFRVTARRSNKGFEMGSQPLAMKLGEDICAERGLAVDLKHPDVTLYVDVISDRILVYTQKQRGPGGLPLGTSGSVVHLISGGIDSPVAAWLMMKRGCELTYLHFYVSPRPEDLLDSKMVPLMRTISSYAGESKTILVPFAPYQLATADLPGDYEPTVFRHFIRLVAERVVQMTGALAVSTGDNLGQVASQTLHNLNCIDAGQAVPILRPLLAYDKDEIVTMAQQIGTYDSSIRQYKDCCSIVSRHPRTRMSRRVVLEVAEAYDFPSLADASLARAEVMVYEPLEDKVSFTPFKPAAPAEPSVSAQEALEPI